MTTPKSTNKNSSSERASPTLPPSSPSITPTMIAPTLSQNSSPPSSPPSSLSSAPLMPSTPVMSSVVENSRKQSLCYGELQAVLHENGIGHSHFIRSCDRITSLDIFNTLLNGESKRKRGGGGRGGEGGAKSDAGSNHGANSDAGSEATDGNDDDDDDDERNVNGAPLTMSWLHHFTGLTTLTVMRQSMLTRITTQFNSDPLNSSSIGPTCANLTSLWLTDCSLNHIDPSAFNTISNLTVLHLSGNKLTSETVHGLFQTCTNLHDSLTTLWINSNRLEDVSFAMYLNSLTSLWCADNAITGFACNSYSHASNNCDGDTECRKATNIFTKVHPLPYSLTELNVSGNKIGCFKEMLGLTDNPNLTSLYLFDPHYGSNPVVNLCNYTTYALYNLPNLKILDSMVIDNSAKVLAGSIYMKKKMYYNMRMKTLKRNCTNVVCRGSEVFKNQVSSINVTLNMLVRKCKDVEGLIEEDHFRRISDSGSSSNDCDVGGDSIVSLERKKVCLEDSVKHLTKHISSLEKLLNSMNNVVTATCSNTIKRLLLEFHTGGNIRVEEGTSKDIWYNSCVDLVYSRITFRPHVKNCGIKGIRVNRITRIHNRFLRYRFESSVREILDDSDCIVYESDQERKENLKGGKVPKRMLEYVFYGNNGNDSASCNNSDEIVRVAEDGFRDPKDYKNSDSKRESIVLHSTVDEADYQRFKNKPHYSNDNMYDFTGQMLLVKTFVGNRLECTEEDDIDEMIKNRSTNTHSIFQVDKPDPSTTTSIDNEDDNNPNSKPSTSHKAKTWHIFNPALALPEYLIDYEYLSADNYRYDANERAAMLDALKKSLVRASGGVENPSDQECVDMVPFLFPLSSFAETMERSCTAYAQTRDDMYSTALNMPPKLQSKSKLFLMTPDAITSISGSTDFNSIIYLNLHGHCLRKIESLSPCRNLKVLVLSFNELNKIEGLQELRCLERLELGFNLIKRISGLKGLGHLSRLELNNNLLNRLEDISALSKQVPCITHLDLRNNPLCKARTYRSSVLDNLLTVNHLDGEVVTEEDRSDESSRAKSLGVTVELIREVGLGSCLNGSEGDRLGGASDVDPKVWMSQVQELDCSNKQLQYICNLENLVNLKKAIFSDNEIAVIEGFDSNVRIEELNLESNRISTMEGLDSLTRLRKLELGHNKILKILPNLEIFTRLAQLSLENNEISSVKPLANVPSLMELYIGNNEIDDMGEIEHLKNLPRLIILDVSGNPFCNNDSYRLFTIYRVKKLKVLDGVGVSSGEVAAAKDKFCGKLTKELIVDKVGHSFFEHIREIQLEGCKIKDVEILNSPEFKNLREINLDNNSMVDLSTLGDLPALSLLRLNHNKVESLRPISTVERQSKARPMSRAFSASSLAATEAQQALLVEERRLSTPSPGDGIFMVNKFNLLNLEILHLGFNRISDIKELELHNFPNLRCLYLPGNDISRVDGLSSCTDLRELCLDKNRIRSLDPQSLVNLKMLRDLRLDENGLRSLSNFPMLPNLCILSVAGNRVNDIIELEKLCKVCDPREISFNNNPVARKQLYRTTVVNMFPNIRIIDGREVCSEERERALHLMHGERGSPLLGGGGQGAVAFMQQQAQQATQALLQQQQQQQYDQQNLLRQHAQSREGVMQGGGQRYDSGHRNSLATNSAGHALLPYPKATVKLTAVNFETFAGHNSGHQILAPNNNNQQYFSVPSAPNRNGDANRRTVWGGGVQGDNGGRGVRSQDFVGINGNGNILSGNGNPGGGSNQILAANYYMNVQNTSVSQQQQNRRSLERKGVSFPRKNSSIF